MGITYKNYTVLNDKFAVLNDSSKPATYDVSFFYA